MYQLIQSRLGFTVLFFAVLLNCPSVQALSLIDQRIKVSGLWKDGKLAVYKLKYRDARKDPAIGMINGSVENLNRNLNRFNLGPYLISWNKQTDFSLVTTTELVNGQRLEVVVQSNNTGQLTALRIESETSYDSPDTLEVLGAVSSAQQQANGDIYATILGQWLVIPGRQVSPALVLTRQQDDRRPEDQLNIDLFGKPLTIGGEVGVTPRYRHNFNLDSDNNRDRVRLDTEVQLELFYSLNPNLAFFLEGQFNYEQDLYRGSDGTRRGQEEFKRGETWVFWGDILNTGVSLQAGRQNFRESREWWWDEDLDGLRIFYNRPFFHFEAGVAEQFFSLSTVDNGVPAEDQDIFRFLTHLSWTWASNQTLGLFLLHQNDHSKQEALGQLLRDDNDTIDEADSTATWLGVRSQNRLSTEQFGEFDFWADSAWVWGEERIVEFDDSAFPGIAVVDAVATEQFDGWALDVGLSWEAPLAYRPSLILGYAIGSREFRQTGLQDNNDRFNSASRFRYYGELLRPELANLQIWTAGVSLPIMANSSISALYHYYRQVDTQPLLRNGRIGPDPNGRNPSIGHEWDLVLALEEWQHWELEFVTSVFRAGSAYGDKSGNIAVDAVFKVNYNF